jgi:stage II sporulation protein D
MIARYTTATLAAVAATLAAAILLALPSMAEAASSFYISGGGDGHGIGMSQYGAYGYAQHGWSYRQILAHYYQGTAIGSTLPTQPVRVLLGTGGAGPPTFTGASSATAPRAGNQTVTLVPSQKYLMKAVAGGNVVLYSQAGRQLMSVHPPLVVRGPGPLNFAGHGQFRGSLEFRWEWGLKVQTVNAVGLEDYVRGVVSAEMPASWSSQALDSQAVAARTYALTTSVQGNGYTLYSDTRSQMYQGVAAETSSTDAAVAATRGQVVTYHGSPVATYFFASSGGYTESIQNVWLGSDPAPWLRGVPDPYDSASGNPYYHWSQSMSMASAAAKLGSLVKGTFEGITITRRGASPRVVTATVNGSGGTTSVTGPQLQAAFGLMSTYISFSTISTNAAPQRTAGGLKRQSLAPPALRGWVSPSAADALVDIQRLTGDEWHTVSQARLGAGGRYAVRLAFAGRYRVVYRGLDGPVVNAG